MKSHSMCESPLGVHQPIYSKYFSTETFVTANGEGSPLPQIRNSEN
jgi:hypothetical protein